MIDGIEMPLEYPRLETPFVSVKRKPSVYEIACGEFKLELDFEHAIRNETEEKESV
jgi:hypothetical protein